MERETNTKSPGAQYLLQNREYFLTQARDAIGLARHKIARGPISEDERLGIHVLVAVSEFNIKRALREDGRAEEAGPEGAATTLPEALTTTDQTEGDYLT
jgi:hypothetical protein